MKNNIRPNNLKGRDQINRMKSLMGMSSINEDTKKSVVELTKMGPDGKVYGIVRENHKYFIKIAPAKKNLVTEDFQYIGGLQNKHDKSYDSYAEATRKLNLKFISLNEALGKSGKVNILENDNLLNESFDAYSEKPKGSQPDTPLGTVKEMGKNDGHEEEVIGDEGETGNPDVDAPKTEEDAEAIVDGDEGDPYVEDEKVQMTEAEKAIDSIIRELKEDTSDKLSIGTAIGNIKNAKNTSKKKV